MTQTPALFYHGALKGKGHMDELGFGRLEGS